MHSSFIFEVLEQVEGRMAEEVKRSKLLKPFFKEQIRLLHKDYKAVLRELKKRVKQD